MPFVLEATRMAPSDVCSTANLISSAAPPVSIDTRPVCHARECVPNVDHPRLMGSCDWSLGEHGSQSFCVLVK